LFVSRFVSVTTKATAVPSGATCGSDSRASEARSDGSSPRPNAGTARSAAAAKASPLFIIVAGSRKLKAAKAVRPAPVPAGRRFEPRVYLPVPRPARAPEERHGSESGNDHDHRGRRGRCGTARHHARGATRGRLRAAARHQKPLPLAGGGEVRPRDPPAREDDAGGGAGGNAHDPRRAPL